MSNGGLDEVSGKRDTVPVEQTAPPQRGKEPEMTKQKTNKPTAFQNVKSQPKEGTFDYTDDKGYKHGARFDLFLIHKAWDRGCDFEDLADGFGAGLGTMGDWSGIRDSSDTATERMFERALNHLFPEG